MILYLKINNRYNEFKLDEENDLSVNYFFDNLISPTEYISDFTHTIKLPRTQKNNNIFKNYGELDMLIDTTSFNPSQEMEYYLQSDANKLLMSGNAFMQKVDNKYFYIILFGALNNVFSKLLNSGWSEEKKKNDNNYVLLTDYLKYNGTDFTDKKVLNASMVRDGWLVDSQNRVFDFDTLKANYNNLKNFMGVSSFLTTNSGLFTGNIVQFLPTNQGLYGGGFKSNKWYIKDGNSYALVNVLNNEKENQKDYGVELNDYQMGEYRTYYLTPVVYMQRLFDIYKEECKRICGYDFILDDSFFNENNDFAKDVVITLPPLFNENEKKNLNSTQNSYDDNSLLPSFSKYTPGANIVMGLLNVGTVKEENLTLNSNENVFTFEGDWAINFNQNTNAPLGVRFNYENAIALYVSILKENGIDILAEKKILIFPLLDDKKDNGEYLYDIDNTIGRDRFNSLKRLYDEVYITRHSKFFKGNEMYLGKSQVVLNFTPQNTQNVKLRYVSSFLNEKSPFFSFYTNSIINGDFQEHYLKNGTANLNTKMVVQKDENTAVRSFQELSLANVFKNVSPFSLILRYCKMLNMIFYINDDEKKIVVTSRYNYFIKCLNKGQDNYPQEYVGIYDLTKNVDTTNPIEILPIVTDFEKIEFNTDSKSKYFENYKKKYDRNYGSMLINFDNKRTNEVKKLFNNNDNDKIIASIISSELLKSKNDIIAGSNTFNLTYPQVANLEKNDYFNFFFRNKNGAWDDRLNNNLVKISDDIPFEVNNNEYAYHAFLENSVLTAVRPRLSTATWDDDFNINFAPSQEEYTQYPFLPKIKYVYELFWKNYIEEIYYYENKKIKVEVIINDILYSRLKNNPFIQIKNNLYLISSIENYNSKKHAKLTLTQIRNIDKLTNYIIVPSGNTYLNFDDNKNIMFDNNYKIII